MVKCSSHETHNNIYPNPNAILMNDQQQFKLNKINEIKDYVLQRLKKEN